MREVAIFRIDLEADGVRTEALARDLSLDEIDRAGRYRFDRDRRRFIVRRAALRDVLGRALGARPESIRFTRGPFGQPSLAGPAPGPAPGPALHFSVSSSGERGLVALCRDRRLGVDIERLDPDFPVAEVLDRVCSPKEAAALRAQLPAGFFEVWTRKEAFLKARGVGLGVAPDQVDTLSDVPGWTIMSVSAGADYAAALAVEGPVDAVRIEQWPAP